MNSPILPAMTPTAHGTLVSAHRRSARGFTLIEVMIVVAIVGILSAIALPSYTSYLRRGDLNDGFANMNQYRVAVEQYYQDNRSYSNGAGCGGASFPVTTANFVYSCATTNANQGYLITATGNAGKRTTGFTYTITESNVKATTVFDSVAVTKACWLVKSTSEC